MKYLGIFLIVFGFVVAGGYGTFLLGKWFFGASRIGWPLQIAITAVVFGLVLWLIEVIREKFRESAQRDTPVILDRNMQEMDDRELGRSGRR